MITKNDKSLIKDTSKEIIQGSGEWVTRRRLKTDVTPQSYDSDFGETVKSNEDQFDIINFVGKVFFQVSEKQTMKLFGEFIASDALIHIPIGIDVIASDILFIRGAQYRILALKEAPLQGFNAARLERI